MADDVLLAKAEVIERCLRRIEEEYAGNPEHLFRNWTKQDSILLNLERCCQACIDGALRLIKLRNLGLPRESREAFEILRQARILPEPLTGSLQAMVGFRNIAVHNYRDLDLQIVQRIITERVEDLRSFARILIQA